MNNPWLGVGEAADGEEAGSARGQVEVPSATYHHGRDQAGFSEEERAGGSSDLTLGGLILGIAIGLTMDITGLIRGHTIAILGIGIQDTGTGDGLTSLFPYFKATNASYSVTVSPVLKR